MKRLLIGFLSVALLLGLTISSVSAQTSDQLQLGMSRDFGYGGFGNDIQGLFTIKVKNPPANLAKVDFYIDTTLMGEVTQTPFSLQFNTDSYPLGNHSLSARGFTTDGTEISSTIIQANFVPASAGTSMILKIVLPIVGLLVVIGVLSLALPLILNKGKLSALPLGAQRNYGIGGGTICPKCERPFPLRLWFINLGASKIDRCPYCGKWSMVRPRPLAELRAAEQAEISSSQPIAPVVGETDAEKLKKELDDSRYQDV
jgi:DNA-directed RNA polymerase subunit RPC12/RpoP